MPKWAEKARKTAQVKPFGGDFSLDSA